MAEQQLDLKEKQTAAQDQGKTYDKALDLLSEDVDVCVGLKKDDYIITLGCEEAEGTYYPEGDDALRWQPPAQNLNKHIEITVQDAGDHRFVPGLKLRCTLKDGGGNGLGEFEVPFQWHPFIFHYGTDIELPGEGDFSFSLTIAQPQFARHSRTHGERYKSAVQAYFGPLHLKPGV